MINLVDEFYKTKKTNPSTKVNLVDAFYATKNKVNTSTSQTNKPLNRSVLSSSGLKVDYTPIPQVRNITTPTTQSIKPITQPVIQIGNELTKNVVDKYKQEPMSIDTSRFQPTISSNQTISAPVKSARDIALDKTLLGKIASTPESRNKLYNSSFSMSKEEERAFALDVYQTQKSIKEKTGQDVPLSDVSTNVNKYKDQLGIPRSKTKFEEFVGFTAVSMLPAISPAMIGGAIAFTAIDKAMKYGLSKWTKEDIQNYSDLLPQGTNQATKDAVDLASFLATALLTHQVLKLGKAPTSKELAIFKFKKGVSEYLDKEAANTINKYSEIKITPDSSAKEVELAYKQAAMKTHPDLNPDKSPIEFKNVQKAKEYLTGKTEQFKPEIAQEQPIVRQSETAPIVRQPKITPEVTPVTTSESIVRPQETLVRVKTPKVSNIPPTTKTTLQGVITSKNQLGEHFSGQTNVELSAYIQSNKSLSENAINEIESKNKNLIPKKSIVLYRAGDLSETKPTSWTKDKSQAEFFSKQNGKPIIEKQFNPDQILLDFSKIKKDSNLGQLTRVSFQHEQEFLIKPQRTEVKPETRTTTVLEQPTVQERTIPTPKKDLVKSFYAEQVTKNREKAKENVTKLNNELKVLTSQIQDKTRLKAVNETKTLTDKIKVAKAVIASESRKTETISKEQKQREIQLIKGKSERMTDEEVAQARERILSSQKTSEQKLTDKLKEYKKQGKDLEFFENLLDKTNEKYAKGEITTDDGLVIEDFIDEHFIQGMNEAFYSKESKPLSSTEIRGNKDVIYLSEKELKLAEVGQRLIKKYANKVTEKYIPRRNVGVAYKTGNIGVKSTADITTVIHEITHTINRGADLTNTIFRNKKSYKVLTNQLKKAYMNFYPTARKSAPLKTKLNEGLSSFIENMALNPTQTKYDYSGIYSEILLDSGNFYNPLLKELLSDVEPIIEKWQSLTTAQKFASRMVQKDGNKLQLWWKDINDTSFPLGTSVKFELLDMMAPGNYLDKLTGVDYTENSPTLWLRAGKRIGSVIHKNMNPGDGFYALNDKGIWEKKLDYNWGNLVALLKKDGTTKQYNEYLYPRDINSLYELRKELVKELKTETDEDMIDTLKSSIEHITTRLKNEGFSEKDAKLALKEYGDSFKEYDKIYDSLNNEILELESHPLVRLLNPKIKALWKRNKGYAPLLREIHDEFSNNDYFRTSKKSTKVSTMKTATGSKKPVYPPVESSIRVYAETVRKAMLQINYNVTYDLILQDKENLLKNFYEVVPLEGVPTKFGMDFSRQLQDKNIIMARSKDYKMKPIVIHDELLRKMYDTVFDPSETHVIMHYLKEGTRIFTLGTTTLYNAFVIPNMTMDATGILAQTKVNTIPFFDAFKSVIKAKILKDPEEAKYLELYEVYGGLELTLTKILAKSDKRVDLIKEIEKEIGVMNQVKRKTFKTLTFLPQQSELMGRYPEFRNAMKRGEHPISAIRKAAEVSGTFEDVGRLGGILGRDLLKASAYANPVIQSLRVNIGAYSKTNWKRSLIVQGVLLAIGIGVTLKAINDYNEAMKDGRKADAEMYLEIINQKNNLDPSQITNNVYFNNKENLFKVRVSPFYNIPSTVIQLKLAEKYMGTKYNFGEYVKAILDATIPAQINTLNPARMIMSWFPTPVTSAVSSYLGYSIFPEIKQKAPAYFKYLPNEEQKTQYTNDLAVKLGEMWNIPPYKVELYIKSQFSRSIDDVTKYMFHSREEYIKSVFITPYKKTVVQEKYLFSGRNYDEFYKQQGKISNDYKLDKNKYKDQNTLYTDIGNTLTDLRKINQTDAVIKPEWKNKIDKIIFEANQGNTEKAQELFQELNYSEFGFFYIEQKLNMDYEKTIKEFESQMK